MKTLDYGPVVTLAMDNDISAAELLAVLREHVRHRESASTCGNPEHVDAMIFATRKDLPAFASTADGRPRLHESPVGARAIPGGLVAQIAAATERRRIDRRNSFILFCVVMIVISAGIVAHFLRILP